MRQYDFCDNYPRIQENILDGLGEHLKKYRKLQTLVIGVSGGIDSGLTCALADFVRERVPKISIIGTYLPIDSPKIEEEKARAELVMKAFCDIWSHDYSLQDIYYLFFRKSACLSDISDGRSSGDYEDRVRMGNVKARLRMIHLFDLAKKRKGMVLSTDNYTEYLMGHWTLHGDVGNYGMIQNLWKTEIYGLSSYIMNSYTERFARAFALEQCHVAIPTAGLGVTESDFDELGASSYGEIDQRLYDYISGAIDPPQKIHKVIKKYNKAEFKREDPFNISRSDLIA